MADEHQHHEPDVSNNPGKSTKSEVHTDIMGNTEPDSTLLCFGNLEIVFPMGSAGLRETPDSCMYLCLHKTACLRKAIAGLKGIDVKEEMVERDAKPGVIGFFARWSKKKSFYNEKEQITSGRK